MNWMQSLFHEIRGSVPLRIVLAVAAAALIVPAALGTGAFVSATRPDSVTICHRTDSVTNPYVQITVAADAADGNTGNDNGQGDHAVEHTDPIATSQLVAQGFKDHEPPIQWGDIIPPHDAFLGLNWPEGMAMFKNGCDYTDVTPTNTPAKATETPTQTPLVCPDFVKKGVSGSSIGGAAGDDCATPTQTKTVKATETPTQTPLVCPDFVKKGVSGSSIGGVGGGDLPDRDRDADAQEHADEHADKHPDEHFDKHADQHADGHQHADEHADQHADEHADQHADEHADQHADEHADQHADEHADQYADEHADQYADQHADAYAASAGRDCHAGYANEYRDAYADQHTDAYADADVNADQHPGQGRCRPTRQRIPGRIRRPTHRRIHLHVRQHIRQRRKP